MKKIKIVYIVSNIDKAIAFEWIVNKLDRDTFDLSFILLNPTASNIESFLQKADISVQRIKYTGVRDSLKALVSVYFLLKRSKPNIIHCHLFDASIIGLVSGKLARIKKRIYTRHHSVYNWKYNPKGIKYDHFINWLATDIVAISENVKTILLNKEKVNPARIHLIHHGFDLNAFDKVSGNRIRVLSQKHNPDNKSPVIGVIARWIEWKGIQYIVPAFNRLLKNFPNALLILANANGPFNKEICELLKSIPQKSFQVIDFESDIFALYKLFNVYVHVPIDEEIEAFGQTYVEALAAGIPSIFTRSGVAKEFITDQTSLLVPFKNSTEIYNGLRKLLEEPAVGKMLVYNGLNTIQCFEIDRHIDKLKELYKTVEADY